MADKAIGDLNFAPGTVDDSNTLFVVQQAGAAYKLSGHEFILAMTTVLDGHGGIKSITYTDPVAPSLDGTMTITLADDSTTTVTVTNGKGISSIAKTGTSGLVDTYTITYNDSTTSTFSITNGAKGDTGDAWYVWIQYASSCSGTPPLPPTDADMGTDPDNWIGIYSGTSSTAPTTRASYNWFEIKGDKGDTGDSITAVTKTSGTGAPGTTDVYTVYVESTGVGTFNVYNGSDGQGSPGTQTPIADSVSGAVGIANAYSREDHSHPMNVATSGTPIMDGTASLGSAATYARTDHIHPTDTSRASQNVVLQAAEQTILATDSGITSSWITQAGLTANHVVGNWGLRDSNGAIPENSPPCDLTIETDAGQWRYTLGTNSTAFYLKPTFILKQN